MKKVRIVLIVCALSLALLTAGLFVLYQNLTNLEARRTDIIQAVKTALNRDVQYEQAEFSLRTGPTITFTSVVVREREGEGAFISMEKLAVKVAILPLLSKELVIRDLQLFRPRLSVWRDASGIWNLGDLLESRQEAPIEVRRLTIKDGRVDFQDRFIPDGEVHLTVEELNVSWRGLGRAHRTDLNLKAAIVRGDKAGRIEATGTLMLPASGRPWTDTATDMRFKVRDMDLAAFTPYYRPRMALDVFRAVLDGEVAFKGTSATFTSAGTMLLKGMNLRCSSIFGSALTPAQVRLDYDLERSADQFSAKKLELSIDDFRAQGSVLLKEAGTDDPLLELRIKTGDFRFEKYQTYMPYGLLPKKVSAYIQDHVQAGVFRLNESSLVGRLSQIRNLNHEQNAQVLQARISVHQGVMTYGATLPHLREIRGELVFRGTDFLLQGMSGYVGNSLVSLEGAIRNYCLARPSTYPFHMTVQAEEQEMVWFAGQEIMKQAKIKGRSSWKLSGDGPLDRYVLTGEGDLTAAAYTYGLLTKAAGMTNRLKFVTDIRSDVMTVRSWQYDVPSVALSGTARYRFQDPTPISVSIRSNTFDLKDLTPLMPTLGQYAIAGKARLQGQTDRRPQAGRPLRWRGEIALEDVSMAALDGLKPLHHIRGVVHLDDRTLTTTGLTVGIGSVQLLLQGRVHDLDHPVGEATIGGDSLDLADIGLMDNLGAIQLQNFNSRWTLQKTKPDRGREIMSVQGTLSAGRGKIGGQAMTDLRADLSPQAGKLNIAAFHCEVMGGRLSGTGSVDWAESKQPAYDFDFQMAAVPAASILKAMAVSSRKISGTVFAKGRLKASGTQKEAIIQSLHGQGTIEIEKGVLKEFSVLSKIFSLLNVSQLLKLHLPDMATDGMPFRKIRASVSMKDGIVSSEDCSVRSDAMNMIVVGKVDVIRKMLNVTIGVQPLQTIDKVVSRVPILGWVLTDEDKRLITVFFDAKGSWDDPQVHSLAARELAKEVFQIFKRTLQLPVKLITDIGDISK